jgi:hypothetical protein
MAEEKLSEQEWQELKARERLTAELQQKLDRARWIQLSAERPEARHEYNPVSRRWMYGEE